jgi:signal transduction histidine kinase
VFLAASLSQVVPKAEAAGDAASAQALKDVISTLDDVREVDVRQLSHALFPAGVDIGLYQAIQLVVGRVPAHVNVVFRVSPEAAEVDSVTDPELHLSERVLLTEILEEGLTNAVKHGDASAVRVAVDLAVRDSREFLQLTVENNGRSLETGGQPLSGLARCRTRAEKHGGGLVLEATDEGWTRLRAWLPRHASGQAEAGQAEPRPITGP